MAKAKKLPSGSWRVQLFCGTDASGKRIYKSFTAETKKEAEYLAAQYQMGIEQVEKNRVSFFEACMQFISARTNVISPRTLAEYTRMAKNDLAALHNVLVCDITPDAVQRFINVYSSSHSPKSVRNLHGFLCSVLSDAAPDLRIRTKLPQRQKTEISIPTQENINAAIMQADDYMRLAVLLAANMGMRRGEICALTWADVEKNVISITKSMAKDVNKEWVAKPPKTTAGKRSLPMSDSVKSAIDALRKPSQRSTDRIFPFTPDAVTHRWATICSNCNFQCRFHDLRHYNASVMLALGVPDKYAMGRMGHSTTNMLKTVYQHLQADKEKAFSDRINSFFNEMQHEMQHEI